MKIKYSFIAILLLCVSAAASAQDWPAVKSEMHPASRWWWLGSAQGAAIIAALESGVESVTEYAPRKAKEAIVGNGAASKEQVQMMLEKTLGVRLAAEHLDATDALAIALCHHFEMSNPIASVKGKGGWEQFLKDHPDRIK